MSKEMAELKADLKAREEQVTQEEEEFDKNMSEVKCPHCLQPLSSYPYQAVFPLYGWVECASCGVVYCPKPLRDRKIKRAKSVIITPN